MNKFGPEGAKELSWIGTLQQLTVLSLDGKCNMNVGICSCGCMEALVCGIGCARIRGVDMWIGCCSGYIYAVVYDAVVYDAVVCLWYEIARMWKAVGNCLLYTSPSPRDRG